MFVRIYCFISLCGRQWRRGRVLVSVCVCSSVCVSGHMLSHRRLPVLSLASGSVCVGIYCAWEREGDYSGYCQLQSVCGCCARSACLHRRIGVGTHTYTRTHTPCACTCVDIPYLLFLLQNIHTHSTHTRTAPRGSWSYQWSQWVKGGI